MMSLKSLQKLWKHLLFCLSPLNHGRMLFSTIDLSNVPNSNHPIPVRVKHLKSLLSKSSSLSIHFSSDSSQELVIVQSSILVSIELIKDESYVIGSELNFEVFDCLSELSGWDCLIHVVVNHSEASSNTDDAIGASVGEWFSKYFENFSLSAD